MRTSLLTLAFVFVPAHLAAPVSASDWPQFQGPNRDGSTALEGVDFDWSEGGPEVLWKVAIGDGFGGVAIEGGEVILLDREPGTSDILRVMDLGTGEEKWSYGYDAPGRLQFAGSRTVPAVTKDHIVTAGGLGHVTCFSRKSQEPIWSVNVAEVYGGEMPMFGWSSAPLLVDDLVVVAALGEEVGLIAFDRATGDEIWITEGLGHSHSTPVLLEMLGKKQVVFLSTIRAASGQDEAAPMVVSAFHPADGSPLWRHETVLSRLPIPPPIQIDEERFFLTGGYRGGSTMVKISKEGGEHSFEELFHIERGAQIHMPLRVDDHLYVLVNENWNNERNRQKEGGLLCLSLDGEEVWRTGNDPFFGRGNAILAGDHILIQDGFNGTLRVVKPSPAGYEQVAEANLFEIDDRSDHEMWANMALSDGKLLLRSQDTLLCVKL